MTAGRSSLNEEWAFERYSSRNSIYIKDQCILKDSWLLENTNQLLSKESFSQKFGNYSCFACLVCIGPKTLHQRQKIQNLSKETLGIVYTWSVLSNVKESILLRAASQTTESMKSFLSFFL